MGSTDSHVRAKVEQGKGYAQQFAAVDVLVCAVLVNKVKGGFRFAWERRDASGAWAALAPVAGPLKSGGRRTFNSFHLASTAASSVQK